MTATHTATVPVSDAPRLAARFLLGNNHDHITSPAGTFSVLHVVHNCPPNEYGETIAAVVRTIDGRIPEESTGYALADRLGGDGVFFYHPDQIVSAYMP